MFTTPYRTLGEIEKELDINQIWYIPGFPEVVVKIVNVTKSFVEYKFKFKKLDSIIKYIIFNRSKCF
jgi:hypothetical protein